MSWGFALVLRISSQNVENDTYITCYGHLLFCKFESNEMRDTGH